MVPFRGSIMSGSKKKKQSSSKEEESPSLEFLTSGGSGSGLGRRTVKKTPASSDRLPSVRPKRDLTLGGVPKKSFAPTIPTSRRVKKEKEEPEATPTKRGRDERRGKKERGKGRRKDKEIIASASVFSMGPADRGLARGRGPSLGGGGGGGSGGGGSQGGADNIKFAKKPDFLTDKTIKPEHISNLEDDIDPQGSSIDELFSNSNQPPTLLPLDYQLHTKARKAVSKQVKIIKEEPMDCDNSTADTADTGDNVKPVKAVVAPLTEVKGHQTKISDLFTPEDSSKGQFLFLQLPDCLPTNSIMAGESNKVKDSSAKSNGITSAEDKKTGDVADDAGQRHCSLRDIPEGLIGKLRVHKSGKVRLTLGDVSFDIAMGTPCGFLQELGCIRNEKPEPKVTVLGQLSHRLVCTPDFESLLEQSELR